MIDFIAVVPKTQIPAMRFVRWIGIAESKYFAWKQRYGKANEHKGHPREYWLQPGERKAIIAFHLALPLGATAVLPT